MIFFLEFGDYSKNTILNPVPLPKNSTTNFTLKEIDNKLEFIEYIKNVTNIEDGRYIQMLTKYLDRYYLKPNLTISRTKVSFNNFYLCIFFTLRNKKNLFIILN